MIVMVHVNFVTSWFTLLSLHCLNHHTPPTSINSTSELFWAYTSPFFVKYIFRGWWVG